MNVTQLDHKAVDLTQNLYENISSIILLNIS